MHNTLPGTTAGEFFEAITMPLPNISGECSSEFSHEPTYRIPKSVYDALLAWTGREPTQSLLARAVDDWLKTQTSGRDWT